MKKLLAIIIAAIMVLSFAGCGNSTAEFEELLISEKWVSIHSGGKMDFKNRKFESRRRHGQKPMPPPAY